MNPPTKKNTIAALIFLFVSVLILWQMLLPGYVLTLDMIFTPKIKILFGSGFFYNTLPLKYLLKIINYLLPGWLIQKLVLIALFFNLGFLGYYFLPGPKKYYLKYWVGLFLAANPFVYERFLAGQWQHLFALAFIAPLSFWVISFFAQPTTKKSLWLTFWLILISVFSLHFLAMALIVITIYALFFIFKNVFRGNLSLPKEIFKKLIPGIIIFLLLSSYWLIPYLLNPKSSVITNFDRQNWLVFSTAPDQHLGTLLNVASLYGFWGESQPWADYFLWPKDNFYLWVTIFLTILTLVLIGIYFTFKNKKQNQAIFFLIAGVLGLIFSCGLGNTIFRGLNQWFFEHLWFWSGFRDSQKWSGLLLLSYAYFASFGIYFILNKLEKIKIPVKYLVTLVFILPILYTYTIWGGFARQLKPVWYPPSWQQVNDILNQDQTDSKVLFLPWHQYFSLSFNQRLITLNPAKEFFDKEIIQGENMEIGGIFSQGSDRLNQEIENILLQSADLNPEKTLASLKEKGVSYIIYASDLAGVKERINFNPGSSQAVETVFASPLLTLYRIVL